MSFLENHSFPHPDLLHSVTFPSSLLLSFWTCIITLFLVLLNKFRHFIYQPRSSLISLYPHTDSPGIIEISRKFLVCPVSTFQLHYLWIVRWLKSATIPPYFPRCALPTHTAMTSVKVVVLSFIYKAQLKKFRLYSKVVLCIAPRSVGSERWCLCQLRTLPANNTVTDLII